MVQTATGRPRSLSPAELRQMFDDAARIFADSITSRRLPEETAEAGALLGAAIIKLMEKTYGKEVGPRMLMKATARMRRDSATLLPT